MEIIGGEKRIGARFDVCTIEKVERRSGLKSSGSTMPPVDEEMAFLYVATEHVVIPATQRRVRLWVRACANMVMHVNTCFYSDTVTAGVRHHKRQSTQSCAARLVLAACIQLDCELACFARAVYKHDIRP